MSKYPEIDAVLAGDSDGCIVCGDCLEVMADMPDGCVDAVVTDPPYGMAFQSNHRAVQHEPISGDAGLALFKMACCVPVKHSRYVFGRWDNTGDAPEPKSVITWVKNNWSMGDLEHEHARQTESIFFWPGPDHIWPQKRPTDVVFADRTGNGLHPTQKPVELMLQVVAWTQGVVWDLFCGSGATIEACKKLGRRYVGIDVSDRYCEIARNRIRDTEKPLFT